MEFVVEPSVVPRPPRENTGLSHSPPTSSACLTAMPGGRPSSFFVLRLRCVRQREVRVSSVTTLPTGDQLMKTRFRSAETPFADRDDEGRWTPHPLCRFPSDQFSLSWLWSVPHTQVRIVESLDEVFIREHPGHDRVQDAPGWQLRRRLMRRGFWVYGSSSARANAEAEARSVAPGLPFPDRPRARALIECQGGTSWLDVLTQLCPAPEEIRQCSG